MGVTAKWDDADSPSSKRIIVTYVDPWTWDEFYVAMDQVDRMTATTQETVDFIDDFSHSKTLPPSKLEHLGGFVRTLDEVGGKHVLVQFGALWQSLQGVIERQSPHMKSRLLMADTVADARRLLAG